MRKKSISTKTEEGTAHKMVFRSLFLRQRATVPMCGDNIVGRFGLSARFEYVSERNGGPPVSRFGEDSKQFDSALITPCVSAPIVPHPRVFAHPGFSSVAKPLSPAEHPNFEINRKIVAAYPGSRATVATSSSGKPVSALVWLRVDLPSGIRCMVASFMPLVFAGPAKPRNRRKLCAGAGCAGIESHDS